MAKLDAAEWVVRLHAERAQSPVERAMWSKMLVRLAAAAIFVAPLTAGAADKSLQNQAFAPEKSPGMYIMLNIVRTWLVRILQPRWLLTRSLQHA